MSFNLYFDKSNLFTAIELKFALRLLAFHFLSCFEIASTLLRMQFCLTTQITPTSSSQWQLANKNQLSSKMNEVWVGRLEIRANSFSQIFPFVIKCVHNNCKGGIIWSGMSWYRNEAKKKRKMISQNNLQNPIYKVILCNRFLNSFMNTLLHDLLNLKLKSWLFNVLTVIVSDIHFALCLSISKWNLLDQINSQKVIRTK